MTIAADLAEQHLIEAFPQLTFGRYNRRLMAGTTSWSQHSWPGGNARDIYIRYDSTITPEETAFLDVVAAYINKNKQQLNVRYLLWKNNAAHYNHIHIDFWPKGYGTPPPGYPERYQYPNGRIVETSGGQIQPTYLPPIPPPPTFLIEGEIMQFTVEEITILKDVVRGITERGSSGWGLAAYGIDLIRKERDFPLGAASGVLGRYIVNIEQEV